MNGKWIWINGKKDRDFYAEFTASFGRVKSPVLEISADSEYAVFLNGKYVYSGQYADYPWYKVYDEIPLGDFVRDGENALTVVVWHCGDVNFCHYVNRPAVRFAVTSEGKVVACSGEDTPCRRAKGFVSGLERMMTPQIGYSFAYDAADEGDAYRSAKVLDDMPEKVFKRPIDRLIVKPFVEAKHIGNGIYDLGAETLGYPMISLSAEDGEVVKVSFGERLEGGHVPRIIGIRDFSFDVIAAEGETAVFNPMRKLGCRYFEVSGVCKIHKIGLLPVEYPFEEKGYKADTPRRQKIYDTAVRTLRLNALEHYFDCPWREQGFYALDSRLQMRYGAYAFDNAAYRRAALKLMSEDRHPLGLTSIVSPTSDTLCIPSFTLFYIIAMSEYAAETGDNGLIAEYFDKLAGLMAQFTGRMKGGLVRCFDGDKMWNFYEWNDGLDGKKREFDSILNLNAVMALHAMESICLALGKADEARAYAENAAVISAATDKEFYDEEKGWYVIAKGDDTRSELANAYAVLAGVATGDKARRICDILSDKKSGFVECTLSMLAFKYDALIAVDEEKYAPFILGDIDEKFGYMLDCGSTSFWETMKGGADFDNAGSLCHGWSALPVYYYKKLVK